MKEEKEKKTEEVEETVALEEETGTEELEALKETMNALRDENEQLIKEYNKAANEADRLKKAALEIKLQLDRMQQDFSNYKRRTTDQIGNAKNEGKAEMVEKFFPVIDVIEKALKMITDEATVSGVKMIESQILAIFALEGVEEIPALGEKFDPNFHNAVLRETTDDEEKDGTVTEVYQKGYKLGDRVLRHSMVKVAGM